MSELSREDWEKWFIHIKFTEESVRYLGTDLCGEVLEQIRKTFLESPEPDEAWVDNKVRELVRIICGDFGLGWGKRITPRCKDFVRSLVAELRSK